MMHKTTDGIQQSWRKQLAMQLLERIEHHLNDSQNWMQLLQRIEHHLNGSQKQTPIE